MVAEFHAQMSRRVSLNSEVEKVVVEMEDITGFIIKEEPHDQDPDVDEDYYSYNQHLWTSTTILARFVLFVVLSPLCDYAIMEEFS